MTGKPIIYTVSAESYLRQLVKAHETADDYAQYARKIGCTARGDEITATPEQAEKLDAKWTELTGWQKSNPVARNG